MNRTLTGFLLILIAALPAAGQGLGIPLVGGNSLTLPIVLPGIVSDVTVSFEGVTNLSPSNLGVSAQLVSITDPVLHARLPVNVALPAGFPVLVRIEPTSAGGLSFTG